MICVCVCVCERGKEKREKEGIDIVKKEREIRVDKLSDECCDLAIKKVSTIFRNRRNAFLLSPYFFNEKKKLIYNFPF